jgi:hypothetical protein
MTHEAERAAVAASLAADSGRSRYDVYAVRKRCVCGCGRSGVQKHHVVYVQDIKRAGGKVDDPRNLVPVWHVCHARHHAAVTRLELRMLPTSVFDFAEELLGPGAAYEYLRRRYRGDDMRLDEMLRRHDGDNAEHDDGDEG